MTSDGGLGIVARLMSPRLREGFFARAIAAWPRWQVLAASSGGLFLAFVLVAETSYLFVFPPSRSALVWLPSGMTLALFLLARPIFWAAWLPVVVLAEVVVVWTRGPPLEVAVAWGLANAIMPLTGALFLKRVCRAPCSLYRVVDVVSFVAAGAVAAVPSTLVAAAASVAWLGTPSFWAVAASWWTSDVLGIVLFGPLVLAWATPRSPPWGSTWEALFLALALTCVGWLVFGNDAADSSGRRLAYIVFPFAAWAALRFGTRGATLATLILDTSAVWQTLHGRGPFAGAAGGTAARVLDVEVFIVVVSLSTLLLAVVMTQQQEARAAAERAEQRAQFLSTAIAALSATLDRDEIVARLSRLCVPRLADRCVIEIVEDGAIERVATGPPVSAVDGRFIVEAPLVVRRRRIGAITMYRSPAATPYGPSDVALAEELGRRAAVAMDNARLYRDAEDAVRVREDFLAVASHELNTPITSLLWTVQALKAGVDGSPENTQRAGGKLAIIERQTRRLARLVEQLLSVSRISAGRLDLSLSDVDLSVLVRSAVDRLSEDLTRQAGPLSIRTEQPIIGRWDAARLEQVVINLLANAIKFGEKRPIEISVRAADGVASLVVRDHGIGIAPDRMPHIFDRFERAVSARAYGGLGLGLYIVRTIVEALGGSVRVESELGEGSTFTVELPCAGPRPPASVSMGQDAGQSPGARRAADAVGPEALSQRV